MIHLHDLNRPRSVRVTGRVRAGLIASVCAAMVLPMASALAQDFTNVPALQRLASSETAKSKQQATTVKAFAAAHHIPLRQVLADGTIVVLQKIDNGKPVFMRTMGTADGRTIGADKLWPGGTSGLGLTGSGVVLGIWEAGGNPDVSHQEFQNRVVIKDGDTTISSHATHVAGILGAAGINAAARGMSYQATEHAYNANNAAAEAAIEAAQGLRLSNHSYGYGAGFTWGGDWYWYGDPAVDAMKDWHFGYYDSEAKAWDDIVYNAPYYLPCYSAANSRNPGVPSTPFDHYVWQNGAWTKVNAARNTQSDYDTIPWGPQMAKNILTIGAVEVIPGTYNSPNDVRLADFSSTGPVDDGRVKPEICGVGVNVFSSFPSNSYGFASGTSMSSPNTCGGLGLLVQYIRQMHSGQDYLASTLRALVCHTAKEAGRVADLGFTTPAGPDYMFGYGLLDVEAASQMITRSVFDPIAIQELTLDEGTEIDFPIVATDSGPIKITIAWTDPAGKAGPQENDNRTPELVNDLDLRVIRNSDNVEFEPWTLNPDNPSAAAVPGDNKVDNLEQVYIATPTPGLYTVRISHKGSTLKPSGHQVVSVITTAVAPDGYESLSLVPGSVIGGFQNAVATLTLRDVVSEAHQVQVTSSNPAAASVPATVTVPAGEDTVTIPITTYAVRPPLGRSSVDVNIIAASSLGNRSVQLHILPVTVTGITLNPSSTAGGNTVTGVVTLGAPAQQYGASIVLTSEYPSVAKPLRNYVLVPAGQTSAEFKIRTFPSSDPRSVTITAERLGTSVSADLTVTRASLSSIVATPSTPVGGQYVKLSVSLDAPATSGGATILLSSSRSDLVAVPATVTIPAGKKSVILTVSTKSVASNTDVEITASRLGVQKVARITLRP